jgi:hypothetical protein
MKFFNDSAYQCLRAKFAEPNIFFILDNASYEIRHSNFLGWLLDPHETHGQENYFLRELLRDLNCEGLFLGGGVEVKREKDQIDLLIHNHDEVLVIENKTRSKDFVGQLTKYREIVDKKFKKHKKHFVYWTLKGESPADQQEASHWRSYSHEAFLEILKKACNEIKDLKAKTLIQDYVNALQVGFLPAKEYVELAKEVLGRHKDELNDVFSGVQNLSPIDITTLKFLQQNSSFVRGNGFFSQDKPFVAAFIKACAAHGYVLSKRGEKQTTYFGFYPKELLEYYAETGRAKSIPFYLSFRFFHEKRKITLKLGLHPETKDNAHDREIILDAVYEFHRAGVGTAITRSGQKHVGIVKLEVPFDPMTLDLDSIDSQINRMFNEQIKKFVSDVSGILLSVLKRS